ncbi:hypothetical protein D3879_09995 [Pseudomonas cavernicola]|uniref:Competence protein CoiA-like N-terminal domain-containing protein n=1 Tax=Pseudomonas cavernicola TaxID=2320866 RepID=A0A418XM46_9PSED|nr:competence protein CoiA family protein [Pseudomonas cavernicola]RJG13548.1 hypothetical protein D3879_09995 [Pseudomonas cavernicola]
MFLAQTPDGRRITATRDEDGFCPSCQEVLTAKLGDVYVWHWAHKPGRSCDYRRSATFWQYSWMSFYHACGSWDIEIRVDGYDFDGINREKKLALKLATKLDWLEEFVGQLRRLG